MALYELWLERSMDGKYFATYTRLPAEKNNTSFTTMGEDSPYTAAQNIRERLRKIATASDQFRVRDRSSIYDNINDALEDILRS